MTTFICKSDVARNPVRRGTLAPATATAGSLLQAAQSIARLVPDRLPRHFVPTDLARAQQPRMLLFLLSYCYARGIYKSTDIERLVQTDGVLRRCCSDISPTANELRQFRSEHREAVQTCLQAALLFLAQEQLAAGVIAKATEAQFAEEANRRIITAMFEDSMEQTTDGTDAMTVELCYLFANERGGRH
jgi:transposase